MKESYITDRVQGKILVSFRGTGPDYRSSCLANMAYWLMEMKWMDGWMDRRREILLCSTILQCMASSGEFRRRVFVSRFPCFFKSESDLVQRKKSCMATVKTWMGSASAVSYRHGMKLSVLATAIISRCDGIDCILASLNRSFRHYMFFWFTAYGFNTFYSPIQARMFTLDRVPKRECPLLIESLSLSNMGDLTIYRLSSSSSSESQISPGILISSLTRLSGNI